MTGAIEINEFEIKTGEHRFALLRGSQDVIVEGSTGGRSAAIAVTFDVDDMFDLVSLNIKWYDQLQSLDRAIEALSAVRAGLADAYGDRPRRVGKCYVNGEFGGCTLPAYHDEPHDFSIDESLVEVAGQNLSSVDAEHAARTKPSEWSWLP